MAVRERELRGKQGKVGTPVLKRLALLALLIPIPALLAAGQAGLRPEIGGDDQHTRYVAFLSKEADYRIFSISDPYRIVVDLPEAEIQVPAGRRGLVLSSRSGLARSLESRESS